MGITKTDGIWQIILTCVNIETMAPKIDIVALKDLCKKNYVKIDLLGYGMAPSMVINARTLLEEIHTVADCDKETFIEYMNSQPKSYTPHKDTPELGQIFESIEFEGAFKSQGYKPLKGDPFIRLKKLKLLNLA